MSENAFLKFIVMMLFIITLLSLIDFSLTHRYELNFLARKNAINGLNKIISDDDLLPDSSNWPLYINEKYAYQIKYPTEIKPQSGKNNIAFSDNFDYLPPVAEAKTVLMHNAFKIEFLDNEQYYLAKDFSQKLMDDILRADLINNNRVSNIIRQEEKIINGSVVYMIEYEVESRSIAYKRKFKDVYISRSIDPDIIHISWNNSFNWDTAEAMLKTFSFLDKEKGSNAIIDEHNLENIGDQMVNIPQEKTGEPTIGNSGQNN